MLGSILKELRNSKGLTIAAMADMFHIATRTYVSYEAEEREPNLTLLSRFAEFYGVSVDYLLGRNSDVEQTLSNADRQLISRYSELSAEDQKAVDRIIEAFYESRRKK